MNVISSRYSMRLSKAFETNLLRGFVGLGVEFHTHTHTNKYLCLCTNTISYAITLLIVHIYSMPTMADCCLYVVEQPMVRSLIRFNPRCLASFAQITRLYRQSDAVNGTPLPIIAHLMHFSMIILIQLCYSSQKGSLYTQILTTHRTRTHTHTHARIKNRFQQLVPTPRDHAEMIEMIDQWQYGFSN